ncbi:hypothetical protein G4Y79_20765 [Phototrophicus methaneseepsis]|uniref:Uncharacterized protein n=1 Tax=Phototrophicus methaneseepsis TaxID=2710758 RepID=A0A7S8E836_9CHLR|nr:hypothetical protein [Phototrophicus methaneseepsis]QPC82089.1 hypothetical protein G4Y79_20765 [Phototrophicus methaneseepsis]
MTTPVKAEGPETWHVEIEAWDTSIDAVPNHEPIVIDMEKVERIRAESDALMKRLFGIDR